MKIKRTPHKATSVEHASLYLDGRRAIPATLYEKGDPNEGPETFEAQGVITRNEAGGIDLHYDYERGNYLNTQTITDERLAADGVALMVMARKEIPAPAAKHTQQI